MIQENLYVASGSSLGAHNGKNGNENSALDGMIPRILPKQFAAMLPKLRASDFDYIIFDMPPVSQHSITPRLARYMDMNLLVVESEKTSTEAVKRAAAILSETKAEHSVVLNKTHNYIPKMLNDDLG
jgi:MinD-like ATPase involved in chromosome partitioning or flagellar assembly